jgi:endonuclease YncB( thermonuclease family)
MRGTLRGHLPNCVVFGALLLLARIAHADVLEGRVVHVGDGDSLTLCVEREPIRVRLVGIDAPEYKQAFGKRSRESLVELCADRVARVTWNLKDRYGRTLGRVSCAGADANAEQVRRGMAWVSDLDAADQNLQRAQHAARAARLGLWRDASPIPPWKWRRAHQGEPRARSTGWANRNGLECHP